MTKWPGLCLWVGAWLLAMTGLSQAKPHEDLIFQACQLPNGQSTHTHAARCAEMQVPENWQHPEGRQIRLAIARLPARTPTPDAAPLVLLAGGPGQAAREAFVSLLSTFHSVREHHDLLLIDQRGTGGSAPIECPLPSAPDDNRSLGESTWQKWAKGCVGHYKDTKDLSQYHTLAAVKDLEAVRKALRIEAWHLLGVSYGTRVALRYAQYFPQSLRSVVLDGVVPDGVALGEEDAANASRAIRLQLMRCEADPRCQSAFPRSYEGLITLAQSLEKQPRAVQVRHPRSGELLESHFDKNVLATWTRVTAYAPELIPLMPWTLHQAMRGDEGPLVAQAWMLEEMLSQQISMGMQLSVLCNEPIVPTSSIAARDDSDFSLFHPAEHRRVRDLCSLWPTDEVSAPPTDLRRLEVPALLLSGEFDPVTPPAYGVRATEQFTRAGHLIVRGHAHGVSAAGCMPELIADFLRRPDPAALDPSCLQKLEAPPFFLHAQGTAP